MAAEERNSFATVNDLIAVVGALDQDLLDRADVLLPLVSDQLRFEASKYGVDLDARIAENDIYASVVKSVAINVTFRTLKTTIPGGNAGGMSQYTESAGPYSFTGTLLNPGGGIKIYRDDLKALGLKRQRIGVLEIYADPRDNSKTL